MKELWKVSDYVGTAALVLLCWGISVAILSGVISKLSDPMDAYGICGIAGFCLGVGGLGLALAIEAIEDRRERQLRKSYLSEEHFGLWP